MARIIFATRKDDVFSNLRNAGHRFGSFSGRGEKEILDALKANGIKFTSEGKQLSIYSLEEATYNAERANLEAVATLSLTDVKDSYVKFPKKTERKARKAHLASKVTVIIPDAPVPEFVNPYRVGDILESRTSSISIRHTYTYKVLSVTRMSYTVAPILLKDRCNNWKDAESRYNNVSVRAKDSYGQTQDFTIPYAGNEDDFEICEDRKRVIRIGQLNDFGSRSGLDMKKLADISEAKYALYVDYYL